MQTYCSFKSAIEKSTKAMTEAQEKNHTHRVDLSPRMPRGQLMRRAVTYTHQAGAGVITPLSPPETNSRYFWVPPRIKDRCPVNVELYFENYSRTYIGMKFVLVLAWRNHS